MPKNIVNTSLAVKKENFDKFAELISNQFNHGGEKYQLSADKEMTDLVCELVPGDTGVDWVLGTMLKYLGRFKNFEREKDLLKIATYCLHKDTELLTLEGWKTIKEIVQIEDATPVATLNLSKNEVEYQAPLQYICIPFKGMLYGQKNRFLDLAVTPDHNLLLKKRFYKIDYSDWELIQAQNAPKVSIYRKDFPYKQVSEQQTFNIPAYKNVFYNRGFKHTIEKDFNEIPTDIWLKFLGWWLSEGGLGNNSVITLTQSVEVNPEYCNEIIQVLKSLGFKFSVNEYRKGMYQFYIFDMQLYTYLKTLGKSHDKYIPRELLNNCSVSQLQLLLDAMIKGDGHIRSGNSFLYTTASTKLADTVQELALKCGYCADKIHEASNGIHNISIHSHKNVLVNTKEDMRYQLDYDDNVYCVSVPNKTIFMRYNGRTCWTGNCYIIWLKKGYHLNESHDEDIKR
ncbi:MAG: hypothetical protein WC346_18895 [Methanogenium sp.]|jgi:UDP-glucuronate decarboxylase